MASDLMQGIKSMTSDLMQEIKNKALLGLYNRAEGKDLILKLIDQINQLNGLLDVNKTCQIEIMLLENKRLKSFQREIEGVIKEYGD